MRCVPVLQESVDEIGIGKRKNLEDCYVSRILDTYQVASGIFYSTLEIEI